jgi:DNA primase
VTTYLGGRGLLDAARAEGWGALVAAPYSDEVAKMLRDVFGDLAERSGLLRGEHVAWPAHRLLIPWRDPSGRVHTLQRRLIVEARAGLPKYVFPAGCQARWPYGVDRLAEARSSVSIVLVEGAIDALAMRELQRRHDVNRIVLGIPGVSAWRDEWTALMRGRRVSVAFDRDEAGDRAALVVGERLRGVASELLRERPPKNAHDWADLLTSERKRAS